MDFTFLLDNLNIFYMVMFGSLVHSLVARSNAKAEKKNYDIYDFITSYIISAFVGVVFGLLGAVLLDSEPLHYAVAGVGAFLGLDGMEYAIDYLLLRAGLKKG